MSDGYYYKFIGCKYDDPTQLDENFNFIGPSIWVGQGDKYLCNSDLKELIETGKKHFKNCDTVMCQVFKVKNKKAKYISSLYAPDESPIFENTYFKYPLTIREALKTLISNLGEYNE